MNLLAAKPETIPTNDELPVIVIGTGPVGIHFIKTVRSCLCDCPIVVFGNEPWEPYNRVKLSSFFAGQLNWDELLISQRLPHTEQIVEHHNCAIVEIDPGKKVVVDELDRVHPYKKLIIATGSSAFIPSIKGINSNNVFTFRDMSDVESLLARRARSRKTVVVGGGVLGIEAAKAMSRENTEVTIIDHSQFLMSNLLDEKAGEMLREHILSLGIKVYLGNTIKEIENNGRHEKIILRNGKEIECDTIILSTGIKPNIELARQAHLSVGRGIRVNDAMQTSDPDIYAIGECSEHRGNVYGIVKPGYEQAKVAAFSLSGKKANYTGSLSATQLKVVDIPVFSMGEVNDVDGISNKKEYIYHDTSRKIYRKLVVKHHKIIGAILVNESGELGRIQEKILNKRFIWPWNLKRFVNTGNLWPDENSADVHQWPATTVVCNCTGVTRGDLTTVIRNGATSLEDITGETGACSVCGSCRPLLTQMLSSAPSPQLVKGAGSLLIAGLFSIFGLLLALVLPAIPYADTVHVPWQWDMLWRDNIFKQISGFSLLGLSAIALVLSLRKRIRKFSVLTFPLWRIIHVATGALAVAGLALHSGYHLGSGLNYLLALSFVGVLIAGGVSSVIVAIEHKLDAVLYRKIKSNLVWIHILIFWPLPVLLTMHVFKTYYF
jgi:nitrite reductase (NADH) large subunit